MPILLDNEPVALEALGANQTVGQFLDDVKGRLRGTGRVVLSLRRDGADVTADDLSSILPQPLTQFRDLEFRTGSAGALVYDALEQARRALADTYTEAKASAEQLASGDLANAMGKLLDCVRIWAQVHETIVTGGALLGVDFESLEVDGRAVSTAMGELTGRLGELKDALQSRDHVRLGDLLRYELDDMLAGWEALLGRLAQLG